MRTGKLAAAPHRKPRSLGTILVCLVALLCLLLGLRLLLEANSSIDTLEEAAGFRPQRDARLLEHLERTYLGNGVRDIGDALRQMSQKMRSELADLNINYRVPSEFRKARLIRDFTGFSDFRTHMQAHRVPRCAWRFIFDSVKNGDVRDWGRCLES